MTQEGSKSVLTCGSCLVVDSFLVLMKIRVMGRFIIRWIIGCGVEIVCGRNAKGLSVVCVGQVLLDKKLEPNETEVIVVDDRVVIECTCLGFHVQHMGGWH